MGTGSEAFRDGKKPEDCPHPPGSPERERWLLDWHRENLASARARQRGRNIFRQEDR